MMNNEELRKMIGNRARKRRQELHLTQSYVADKMGVTSSTIQRYEAGTIDNSKKMVLDSFSDILHVSVKWLKGETDECETDVYDEKELQIRDEMELILEQLFSETERMKNTKDEVDCLKDVLLLMLRQYEKLAEFFACSQKDEKEEDVSLPRRNSLLILNHLKYVLQDSNDLCERMGML